MFPHKYYQGVLISLKISSRHCYNCIKLLSSQAKEQPSPSNGPWNLYSEKLLNGALSKDPHQEKVVQHLQDIYDKVINFRRPIIQPRVGESFFNLFKKTEPPKIEAPKGLYIYGSVGGGKTMLMDLFFETVPVRYFYNIYIKDRQIPSFDYNK